MLTEAGLQKLQAAHTRHNRCLLKIRWPERIRIRRLYETSGATSLRREIMVRRLDFLGKALRQDRVPPARECMEQYFRHLDEATKVRGRRPITIVSILDQALRLDDRRLQTWGYLQVLRTFAVESPGEWDEMRDRIVTKLLERAAEADRLRRSKRQPAEAQRRRTRQPHDEEPEGQPEPRCRRVHNAEGDRPAQSMEDQADQCVFSAGGYLRSHSPRRS